MWFLFLFFFTQKKKTLYIIQTKPTNQPTNQTKPTKSNLNGKLYGHNEEFMRPGNVLFHHVCTCSYSRNVSKCRQSQQLSYWVVFMSRSKHNFSVYCQNHMHSFLDLYFEFDLQRWSRRHLLVSGFVAMGSRNCHDWFDYDEHLTGIFFW